MKRVGSVHVRGLLLGVACSLAGAAAPDGVPDPVAPPPPPATCLKWGASSAAGTGGGVVTWGFVASGIQGSPRCGIHCPGTSVHELPNFYPDPANHNGRVPVSLESLQPIFQAAFDTWARAADIEFRYVGIDRSGRPPADPAAIEPMIRISAYSFGGLIAYFTAAATWAPPPNGGTLAGDIFLNTNVGYQDATVEDGTRLADFPVGGGLYLNDIFRTALHEIGHAIGLGHSADCAAVMHGGLDSPAIVPVAQRRELSGDDRAGVQLLYGPPKRPQQLPAGERNGAAGAAP